MFLVSIIRLACLTLTHIQYDIPELKLPLWDSLFCEPKRSIVLCWHFGNYKVSLDPNSCPDRPRSWEMVQQKP